MYAKIRNIFTSMKGLEWPKYGEQESKAVNRVIRSGQIFAGEEVKAFEAEYSSYVGAKYAVAVGNATQGLHLALASLGVGVGDEVIVTAYSWISTASCIVMQNAVPIFCDIEDQSLGIDPNKIENLITPRTKCLLLTHVFGYPSDIIRIKDICKRNSIYIIEDNSHAHGAKVNGIFTGTFGDVSVGSLHQRKTISAGDGGIIVTNNSEIKGKIYRQRSFGDKELSYNYRMTEFSAALARVGLSKLEQETKKRIEYVNILTDIIESSKHLQVVKPRQNERAVYYALLIKVKNGTRRIDPRKIVYCDERMGVLRRTWEPLYNHPHFANETSHARGKPWSFQEYIDKGGAWKTEKLETCESVLKSILEFYVHPTYDIEILKEVARGLANEAKNL